MISLGITTGCGQGQETEEVATATEIIVETEAPQEVFTPDSSPDLSPLPPSLGGATYLAFSSDRDGNNEIFLTSPDGSEITQLTDGEAENYFPEFSPSGYQLLYWTFDETVSPPIVEFRILVADGSERVLGPGVGWSSWSPDGNEVVIVNISSNDSQDILRIDSTGNPTWLTDNPADDREPDWSPDGTTIAFASYREGRAQIYLMNPDGSNQRRLSSLDMAEFEPDWSPDGEVIAFVSGDQSDTQIYLVDADGSNLRQLTDTPGFNENPAWSPDGTLIAFWSDRTGNREIFVIGVDGTGLQQITDHPASDENPTWSP
jgi:TolB protein